MPDTGLAGKTVLVTGANSGIGAAIACAFARERACVAIHYLEQPTAAGTEHGRKGAQHTVPGRRAAEVVASAVRGLGGDARLVQTDLADPHAIPPIFDAIGPVDVLVNNAAHCELPDSVDEISAGVIDRHFSVNARAPVLLIAEFARRFRARGGRAGRVVNVSTDAARAFATQISYGASKAALEAFTRSLAIELGPFDITVNAVAPGPVQTGYITARLEKQLLPSIPLGRIGAPEDVAEVVVFLASTQARWVTGQVLQVSGGHAL